MKKITFIIISLLFTGSLFSQGYQFQAEIGKIFAPDFYKVELQPEIISKLNPSFSDIRIKDQQGKEIPYYTQKEPFEITKRVFKEYEIKEKIRWRNGATVLVVENKSGDKINNIQLQIKNFDVRKHLELAGSDDYQNWYTIKENYLFRSANGLTTTSEVKSLNFPYTDYKYYRIIIYDVFSLPINVLKVGYYDTYQEQGKFKKLTIPAIERWDSLASKETYVKVNFEATPYFDKLVLRVKKPTYFYRSAKICLKKEDKKGRTYFQTIKSINLNSNTNLTFYENEFPYKEFYIVIENEDNLPLEDIGIEAYQLNRYLITYLEKDNEYQLVFKNQEIKTLPNYDIDFFKNKVGNQLPILMSQKIEPIKQHFKQKKVTSELWIWGVIGLVALLLGYVSYKMIIEMEKSK